MRLAWFTPFSSDSAIAGCSSVIVDELARHCEVDVWTHGDEVIKTDQKVIRFDPGPHLVKELDSYDHCIFNMGNNLSFHAEIFEVLQQRPGVVILHDLIMQHFFAAYYLLHKRDIGAYIFEMERAYGTAGLDVALQSTAEIGTPVWLTDQVARFPLFERVIDLASGVFVHSEFHRKQLENQYIGEIGVAYLPYTPTIPKRGRDILLREFDLPNRVLAVSTGALTSYKRIERVIAAIGSSPRLAEQLIYVVIGAGEHGYQEKLQSLVDELGLRHSVRLLGRQTDAVLREFLAAADFAINLRFPNSEGCSLSLIEQMAFRNPVIAIDSGMYREMPDAAVIKLPVDDEGDRLIAALEQLTFNEPLRAEMGQSAEAFARTHFSLQRYVARLLDYISRASFSLRPVDMSLMEVSRAVAAGRDKPDCAVAIEPVLQQFHSIVNGRTRQALYTGELKTLGIWLVTSEMRWDRGELQVYRELVQHLVERHQIDCEVWCHFHHQQSVAECFEPLLSDSRYAGKLRVMHELNWASTDADRSSTSSEPVEFGSRNGRVSVLAGSVSRADCFLVGPRYLEDARTLNRPLFISITEKELMEAYRSPGLEGEGLSADSRAVREAIQYVARYGASFICSSERGRSLLVKHLRSPLNHSRVAVICPPADASLPSPHDALLGTRTLPGKATADHQWSDVAEAYFLHLSAHLKRLDMGNARRAT